MAADGLIREGNHLVLDVNGEKLNFHQKLRASGTVRVGKYTVPAAPLVGAPFGSLFEVSSDGKSLQRVLLPPDDGITRITDTERDNSNLFDRNTANQKLTQEEIQELKASGKGGSEIIEALISNSATFQNKTEFSQDKYKRRKAKKYITHLTVRKPSARLICEAYSEKHPERVWHLRHDTLACALSLANVCAGAKVLVVEQCMGVFTAAAVERMGGVGAVCALQLDERQAQMDAVRLMNLDEGQRSVLFTAYASSLLREREAVQRGEAAPLPPPSRAPQQAVQQQALEQEVKQAPQQEVKQEAEAQGGAGAMEVDGAEPQQPAEAAAAEGAAGAEGSAAEADAGAAQGQGEPAGEAAEGAGGRRQGRGGAGDGGGGGGYGSFAARPEVVRDVATTGFDSCLLANPRLHPTALLAAVWPLLAPSATFAVYSPWAQPLAETLTHLQVSRNGVMLQLQESWLRPYQVLPARTHPHMSCSGTGGFVLSGIKVVPPEASPLEAQLGGLTSPMAAPPGRGSRGREDGGAAASPSSAEAAGAGEDESGAAGEQSPGGRGGRGRGRGWGRDGGRGGGGRGWGRDNGGRGGRDYGGRGGGGGWNRDNGRGGGGGRGRDRGRGKRSAEGPSGDSPATKRAA
ncbi:hypothetical protein HYH03_016900 [Edaphochlamys debaryana]|uniref:tRNA (adenine(58)-N(1))-methyltransferase non-catalytic subunit TRM6 n=1 Tax=Edaphochlamys debaryana TaxID=47281 RepID=A0A836BPM8_9CHLO|nr:hypothetical protein HYH03_016900 [Edaphochlamys debaryana]|eukprot:KAG2484255.1 hypothetical protein HYH03_016900 [Edaphochlamys debaryana]